MADNNRSISSSSAEIFDDYDIVVDDLSSWEFIDPSSSDQDDVDVDNFSLEEEEEEHPLLLADLTSEFKDVEVAPQEFGSPGSDISMDSLLAQLQDHVDNMKNFPEPLLDDVVCESPNNLTEERPLDEVVYNSPSNFAELLLNNLSESERLLNDVVYESSNNFVDQLLDEIAHKSPEGPDGFGLPPSDLSMQEFLWARAKGQNHVVYDVDEGEEEDYDDYEDDEYDLYDDELVPLEVSGKLGRQRIRKLGKRACPRMNKSKRLPYHYNRPGCVRGKHGLGVQHSYI